MVTLGITKAITNLTEAHTKLGISPSPKDILARGEKVPHPYIGIRMVTLTPEIARQFNENPNFPVTAS